MSDDAENVAKSKKKRRELKDLRRRDLLVKYSKGGTHRAYYWMHRVKEGIMPPCSTSVRKALDAIEAAIVEDFGPLNALQIVEINILRPLLIWWILHPGLTEKGALASDFQWIHVRIESGLKRIAELASAKKPGEQEDLYTRWRREFLAAKEEGKKPPKLLIEPAKDEGGTQDAH